MSSMAQGSNDMEHGKNIKSDRSRRKWTSKEEEILLACIKELVAKGWKTDNGFKRGYLNKLEEGMKTEFPDTDLKGMPNIHSKLTSWKKNYYSLTTILSRSGVGFNLNGTHVIDCENDMWEQIIKVDSNAKGMRYKSWPYFEDWKEIFGKDRATGDNAEDVFEAYTALLAGEKVAEAGMGGEAVSEDVAQEDSVHQSGDQLPRKAGKKRKAVDEYNSVCDVLVEMHQDTAARFDKLVSKIGYEADLGKARKEVFDLLGDIPGMTLDEKFDICEMFAEKVERLEIFMGLPHDARPQYVLRLLKTKKT